MLFIYTTVSYFSESQLSSKENNTIYFRSMCLENNPNIKRSLLQTKTEKPNFMLMVFPIRI